MNGSLALARGILYVGVQAKTARVLRFDRGGRRLAGGFSFRDAGAGRSTVSGLAVDGDERVWVADTPGNCVRVFSAFGREVERRPGASSALPGSIVEPVDVDVQGDRAEGTVVVASRGERLHAVQVFEPDLLLRHALSSLGDPRRPFAGVNRVAIGDGLLYVSEAERRCVQVFRGAQFLFAFHLTDRLGTRLEPTGIAPLPGGRMVVAFGGAESSLVLVDGSGRFLRLLAGPGIEEGRVQDPGDVVVDPGADEHRTSVYAIDRDGLRVQVFDLHAHCLGSFSVDEAVEERRDRGKKGGR
jgi:hypothetical protein